MVMAIAQKQRKRAPVFVLGCPRSGTTLLYDMLLSAGGFAVYLAESNVFNVLSLRFGDLGISANLEKLLPVWLQSKLFRASGLNARRISEKLRNECRSTGDFLRIVMDEIGREQGMGRWAENSPETVLYLPSVKKNIPEALVIHIIRDGRDVATSLSGLKYVRPLPWENRQSVLGAAVYWEWIVERAQACGRLYPQDYLEIRFEDLISSPQSTLDRVGQFIDHDLSYSLIKQVAYGSIIKPNTTFASELYQKSFNPIGRWKSRLPPAQTFQVEQVIGTTLNRVGYELSDSQSQAHTPAGKHAVRAAYRSYFEAKLLYKRNPFIQKLRRPLTAAEIDATMLAEDHAPIVRPVLVERHS